jgi:hypothetical protein
LHTIRKQREMQRPHCEELDRTTPADTAVRDHEVQK